MRLDLRLVGIAISMIVIILLAIDFKKKIDNYNNVHQNISSNLYELKHNIHEQTAIINTAVINLVFNNDTFVENYKTFKKIENRITQNRKLKELYPRIYLELQELFTQQKEIFEKTNDFIVKNAKVKNSLSILYKRLNKKYDEEYNKNFIDFLTASIYQQTNIVKYNITEKKQYEYFKTTKDKNIEYKLNFIHINILYTQIPKLKKLINEIQQNPAKDMLNRVFITLDKEAEHQKRSMQSKLFLITAGSIIFFVIILFLARDIKKNLEALREKDKFIYKQSKHAAMGEMIDAIAHQWKQPINIIKMRVEFLTLLKEKNEDIKREDIEEFQKSVDKQLIHMTDTLDEFRAFLRPNKTAKVFSVKRCAEGVLLMLKDELLKNTISSEIIVHKEYMINGIENEFKHVLINLINNAKDAFVENKIKKRKIVITIESNKIEIQDNAGGIPKDAIDKIFEANFTTKDEDKGTGIGLYMTKQILEKIDATIKVKNQNDGACFSISTPNTNNI